MLTMYFGHQCRGGYKYLLNKQELLFLFAAISTSLSLTAQVNNTGGIYISGNVYAASDFTNASSAVYRNDGNLYLNRNFRNDQPLMVSGSGTTFFIGSSLQQINGSQQPAFNHVNLNNTAGVQMNVNTFMGGIISPVAGSLYFNGYILTMAGMINTAYTNASAFNVTPSSSLIINGDATPGSKLFFDTAGNTLYRLIIPPTGAAILGNNLNIASGNFVDGYGTITANGTFDANGLLTLKSDANGTARVGLSRGSIIGNVIVERHIPPFRAWRLLAVPFLNSAQTINQAWQEGVVNPCLGPPEACNIDPNPGHGTQITYNGNISDGFDPNVSQNPSLVLWDVPAQKWTNWAPPTTGTNIKAYSAYNVFVRGSRANNLSQGIYATPDPTTLRITGELNEQNGSPVTVQIAGNAGQYVLVGNPFASSINVISALRKPASIGINKTTFTVTDPRYNNDGRNVGAYVVYNDNIKNWVPFGISYPDGYPPVVQSGQGFMLQLSGSGIHQIEFRQVDKFAGQQADVFGIQVRKPNPTPVIYTNLMAVSNDSLFVIDGVAAGFNEQFRAGVDSNDVSKLWNVDENLALVRNDTTLSIELRPLPAATDTLFYRLYLRQQPYTLKIFSQNLPLNIHGKIWIVDKYLNTQTEINLQDTILYSFTPNSDTNSYRNRFMLVFQRTPSSGQPVYAGEEALPGSIKLFPNPVATGDKIAMQFNNLPKGTYKIFVTDVTGKPVMNKRIEHMGDKGNYSIELSATQASGEYTVKVVSERGFEYKTVLVIAY